MKYSQKIIEFDGGGPIDDPPMSIMMSSYTENDTEQNIDIAMSNDTEKKLIPAYVSFETVKSFTTALHESAVPPVIDKSLMTSMSGAVQSHLMSALRFLHLIDDDDRVTDSYRSLIKSVGTQQWAAELKSVLDHAYAEIIGDLQISHTTDKQLREAFKGVDGSMLDRVVRFYLRALTDAGVTLSPHLGKRKRGSGTKRSAGSQRAKKNGSTDGGSAPKETPPVDDKGGVGGEAPTKPPAGMYDFLIPMREKVGFIRVRTDITMADYAMAEAVLNAVKVLAETNSNAKK